MWAQSRLYALSPHNVLICAHQPAAGLIPRIVEFWQETQGALCSLDQAAVAGIRQGPLIEELRTLDFGEFLAHGMVSAYEKRPASVLRLVNGEREMVTDCSKPHAKQSQCRVP